MQYHADSFLLAATDLANHLGCHHLTELERKFALGELKRPYRNDPSLDVLIQRGREHEAAFVAHLKAKGKSVVELRNQSMAEATKAMAAGADVIVQARLEHGNWMGIADVLVKVPGRSRFGDWHYEVYDTKLAQSTRAATILQLCLYSDLLSIAQDAVPEKMYVVKPVDDFVPEEYRYHDFQAYYQMAKKNFAAVMAGPAQATYPEPVEHCGVCNWWTICDKQRHDDDYLSLVAGIRSLHIDELKKQDIRTLEAFAAAADIRKPDRGNKASFLRRQSQARVQLEGRQVKQMLHKLLPVEDDRGFHRLPEPNTGDIYFDIEGDAFFPGGSLEYLLGYAYQDDAGTLVYEKLWATNRVEEKRAFASFMQFVANRWKRFPHLHVYHFGHYEASAVKRMASVHSIYEQEVDELLRAGKFVDLHAIFKEALLASVERYSLKDLEKLTKYTRKVELHDASVARKNVECALELNEFSKLPQETKDVVAVYNEDDCLATEALHVWMEQLRANLVAGGYAFRRPAVPTPEPNQQLRNNEIRARALYNDLVKGLPEDRAVWTAEQHARWLLAHQVDYFRREDKTFWWEHYRIHRMEHEDLVDERKAIVGLEFVETLPLKGRAKLPVHRYRYPPQEIGVTEGDALIMVNSQNEKDRIGKEIGTVEAVSLENYTVDIKKKGDAVNIHPPAVHVFDWINPGSLWTSLMNLAQVIDDEGLAHAEQHQASKDLLMKRKPQLIGGGEGADVLPGETPDNAAIRLVLQLNRSILPIQGPPGTGKTHTGARMILELVKAKKKVGVTAISHRVITTLIEKVYELNKTEYVPVTFAHKVTDEMDHIPAWVSQLKKAEQIVDAIAAGSVTGGTAWLWADDRMTNKLDYLFIDEAGQMSLSQALAASRAARNIVLLGDPQQLEQPQRGAHPEGSDVAALTYLLEGLPTMPEGKGLFLDVTRRIHPDICRFTSEIFYEGKLTSLPGLEKQKISGGTKFDGAGLRFAPVFHVGNQNSSPAEVKAIRQIVDHLLEKGRYTDRNGDTHALTKDDILIVAPYNAQVATLISAISGVQTGTVDKFQGKEAPVVIYSMTSSTAQDAPRGMNFLFNLNRLNVATSRAKSICILVASPALTEPECHTIDQLKRANALCRYLELATVVNIEPAEAP